MKSELTLHGQHDRHPHGDGEEGLVLGLTREAGLVIPRRRTELDGALDSLATFHRPVLL